MAASVFDPANIPDGRTQQEAAKEGENHKRKAQRGVIAVIGSVHAGKPANGTLSVREACWKAATKQPPASTSNQPQELRSQPKHLSQTMAWYRDRN